MLHPAMQSGVMQSDVCLTVLAAKIKPPAGRKNNVPRNYVNHKGAPAGRPVDCDMKIQLKQGMNGMDGTGWRSYLIVRSELQLWVEKFL